MRKEPDFENDLASIRTLMERSVRFISLSGLSGVLAGCYALAGAAYVYYQVQYPVGVLQPYTPREAQPAHVPMVVGVGLVVLVASLLTGYFLSQRKASKLGVSVWGPAARRLIINLAVPLATGGVFVLICLFSGYYLIAFPASLVFYGLALTHASANLYDEVRYLGYTEILLGLLGMWMTDYPLLFWAIGFGVLHVVYGLLMYRKYDR